MRVLQGFVSVVVLGLACSALAACSGEDEPKDAASGAQDAGHDAAPEDPALLGCKKPTLKAGADETIMLDQDGTERSYVIHVGKDVDPKKPTPLVLNYHGLTSNAAQEAAFSGMNATADEKSFIVAYPEGVNKSFNAGSCCGALVSPPNTIDDAAFAHLLVEDISSRLCVDSRRVYSTGMSNGGYMSEYNACKNADLFAAVAPVSAMGFVQPECEPSRPIPMLAFNGTADTLVSYDGSNGSVMDWLGRNGCKGDPVKEDFGASYCETWSDCDADVELTHCTLTGMGHCWPGTAFCPYGAFNVEIKANDVMWQFFERFTLP